MDAVAVKLDGGVPIVVHDEQRVTLARERAQSAKPLNRKTRFRTILQDADARGQHCLRELDCTRVLIHDDVNVAQELGAPPSRYARGRIRSHRTTLAVKYAMKTTR